MWIVGDKFVFDSPTVLQKLFGLASEDMNNLQGTAAANNNQN